jgi:hypothetical protein
MALTLSTAGTVRFPSPSVALVAGQRTIDGVADADFLYTIVELFKEWGFAL